jgi:hypothetical protein
MSLVFVKAAISGDVVPRPGVNVGGLRRRVFPLLGFLLNMRDYPKEPAARPPALPGEDRRFKKNERHYALACPLAPRSGNR